MKEVEGARGESEYEDRKEGKKVRIRKDCGR